MFSMFSLFTTFTIASLLCYSFFEYIKLNAINFDKPEKKVLEISNIIKSAAMTYIFSQFKILLIVGLFIALFLGTFFNGKVCIAFGLGALFSWFSGFLAMYFSVKFNYKVALLAKNGFQPSFNIAFGVGKLIGLLVNTLAFSSCYLIYLYSISNNESDLMNLLMGFSFGASLISVFARIGGGIFTKGADIGADLVGKIEKDIPEDDPRNPAVIADATGDNAGDGFGASADLFETYVVILSAAISLILCSISPEFVKPYIELAFTTLAAGAFGSILILWSGWNFDSKAQFSSLGIAIKTLITSSLILTASFYHLFFDLENIFPILICSILGIISGVLIMPLTEFYTSGNFNPVLKIVEASKQSAANNIIQGIAVGFEAVFTTILFIVLNILTAYSFAGIIGIAFSCLGMVSICGVVLALDAFGPITDNAGGLVEMGGLDKEVRETTDKLDIIGNMTKATTKGYAVFTAGLAACVLSSVFAHDLMKKFQEYSWTISLTNVYVLIGLLLGIGVIAYFASLCLISVNNASIAIMNEVRHQFKTISGIMEGKNKPDYNKAIEILTKASLKEMILPTLLPILFMVFLFESVYLIFSLEEAFLSIAGFIMGVTFAGILLAISMTVSGGAWDNAKKFIESNGKKGSFEHQSAVTGDTVGDPYKDTVGVAMNPVIKLVGIISILLVMLIK